MHGNSSEIKKIVDWAVNKVDEKSENFAEKVLQIAETLPEDFGNLNFRKVLSCYLIDPLGSLSVTDKCLSVGLERATWYNIINSEKFAERSVQLALKLKGTHALPITQRFLDNALYADKDKQFGDRVCQIKYLNDMGIIKEQSDNTLSIDIKVVEQERLANQQTGLNRFGFRVGIDQPVKTDQKSDGEQGRSSCGESGGISPVDNEPDIQK